MKRAWRQKTKLMYLLLPSIALLAIALIFFSSKVFHGAAIDLTEQRVHSLSQGTQKILANVDGRIQLSLYYSDKASSDLPQFRVYAARVQALLQRMADESKGKISLAVIDPEPFSDAEGQADAAGLQAIPIDSQGATFYFGMLAKQTSDNGQEKTSLITFFDPNKEPFLEYDLAKLIAGMSVKKRPVLAILSDVLTGPSINAVTGQQSLGWVIDRKLSERYDIRRLLTDSSFINQDVDALILLHPRDLPEPTLFAIDQFVLRGGRLLVFVDPNAESDRANTFSSGGLEALSASDIKPLFRAWGIEYSSDKIVLDAQNAMQVGAANQTPQYHFEVLGVPRAQLNQNDVVSANLEKLNFSSAGNLGVAETSPLRLEVLVQSSNVAMLADAQAVRLAEFSPENLRKTFKPSGDSFILAARYSGLLKSAFVEKSGPAQLMTSQKPAQIVVIADTDMLSDRLWVQEQNFLGQQVFQDIADNGDFVMNLLDHMTGDENLIALRARNVSGRPFDRLEKVQRGAQLRYQDRQLALEAQLEAQNAALEKLQAPELSQLDTDKKARQQAVARIQKNKTDIRKQLRDVQYQLNKDINELVNEVKIFNIILAPAFYVLVAFLYAWRRSYKRRSFLVRR
jgi:ABC-type uncharacterized transport system involved in gliding motility auxiliary subunit